MLVAAVEDVATEGGGIALSSLCGTNDGAEISLVAGDKDA